MTDKRMQDSKPGVFKLTEQALDEVQGGDARVGPERAPHKEAGVDHIWDNGDITLRTGNVGGAVLGNR